MDNETFGSSVEEVAKVVVKSAIKLVKSLIKKK